MVAEPWAVKMANLKHALPSAKKKHQETRRETIGILSFEVASVMSKAVRLHKSLTNPAISKLRNEVFASEGVKTLVSSDETYLLDLVLSEKLDELAAVAAVVSRLGKKCTIPQLQGFQHVYGDIISGAIDVRELGFLVKDMDAMARKMERFVTSTATLHGELEVLSELEAATKKFQQNQHEESRKVFEQKLVWQKQDVRHLKDVSLWNQTYDKIVAMLVRTVCTLYARICVVFGDTIARREMFSSAKFQSCRSLARKPGQFDVGSLVSSEKFQSCRSLSQKQGQIHVGSLDSSEKFQSCRSLSQKPGQMDVGSLDSTKNFQSCRSLSQNRGQIDVGSLDSSENVQSYRSLPQKPGQTNVGSLNSIEKFQSCRSMAQKPSELDEGSLDSSEKSQSCRSFDAGGLVSSEKFHSCRSSAQKSGGSDVGSVKSRRDFRHSGGKSAMGSRKAEIPLFKADDFNFACGLGPGRLFMECLSMSTSVSTVDDPDDVGDDRSSQLSGLPGRTAFGVGQNRPVVTGRKTGPRTVPTVQPAAPTTTVGGSSLALHYSNVILVIEKLLNYPHLVGQEARDDLYRMLPASLRSALKTSLKSYVKHLAIYDAPLAHGWKDRLDGILAWLAPLARNMVRWHTERSFEQQRVVSRTANVLLLQTLYFADRARTEAAICELLVGLNYICRYEWQQNALLDCASSFDFDEWPLQY